MSDTAIFGRTSKFITSTSRPQPSSPQLKPRPSPAQPASNCRQTGPPGSFLKMDFYGRFLLPFSAGQCGPHEPPVAASTSASECLLMRGQSLRCRLPPCCHRHGDPGEPNSALPSPSLSPLHKGACPGAHYTYHYGAHALYMI